MKQYKSYDYGKDDGLMRRAEQKERKGRTTPRGGPNEIQDPQDFEALRTLGRTNLHFKWNCSQAYRMQCVYIIHLRQFWQNRLKLILVVVWSFWAK